MQDIIISAYVDEIRNYKLLTKEQELELSERIKNGDEEAVDILAKHNLRLVINIAKRYAHVNEIPLDDLICAGNIGLLKSVRKFDGSKGFKFSTYATWWIKQSIRRYLSDCTRTIRIPQYKLTEGHSCPTIPLNDIEIIGMDDIDYSFIDHSFLEKLLLSISDERKREIISKRFGLYGQEVRTLNQLGNEMNLSRERVRQLQNEALQEMRDYASSLK